MNHLLKKFHGFNLTFESTNRLAARLQKGEEIITFDKDDDDTLDFVTASSNLRSCSYGIEGKTRWEVKGPFQHQFTFTGTNSRNLSEMAGNIIPAIATTNAIISGLIVLQALLLLKKSYSKLRNVHLQFKPAVPLSTIRLSEPNSECGVCRDTYTSILCDPSRTLLGDVVKGILGNDEREVSVYEDKRVLSDPDWEDNFERTLESLNVTRGKFLSIVDEEGEWSTIAIGLGTLPYVLSLPVNIPALTLHFLFPLTSAPITPRTRHRISSHLPFPSPPRERKRPPLPVHHLGHQQNARFRSKMLTV